MSNCENMTLDEFVAKESKRLALFKSYYEKNHNKNPKIWPLSTDIGAWDEMFQIFDPADADKIEDIPHEDG